MNLEPPCRCPIDSEKQILQKLLNNEYLAMTGGASISTSPKQYDEAPSSAAIQTSGGDVFELETGEKGFIQNLGTNPLFVRKATGATSSAFHYVLAGAATNDDGTGGSIEIDDHVGVVSVAGTSPRFVAWKV